MNVSRYARLAIAVALVTGLAFVSSVPPPVARAQAPATTLTLQKTVTVNGLGYATSGSANPGDTLTYDLRITNNSTVVATNVTLSDVLAPGQTALTTIGAGCTYDAPSRMLSCMVPTIGPGSHGDIFLVAGVDSGFSGGIPNVATAQAANAPTTTSNATMVTVGSPQPVTTPSGTFICGIASATGPASITIDGVVLPIAAVGTIGGIGIVVGGNYCLHLQLNAAGQVTSLVSSSNLPLVSLVCGVTSIPGSGQLQVGGLSFALSPGTAFPFPLATGQYYCFLLAPDNTVAGILSLIPTSATISEGTGVTHRLGRMTAQ